MMGVSSALIFMGGKDMQDPIEFYQRTQRKLIISFS
jgi:hypothetical protein